MDAQDLTFDETLMALEEMPPWTGYVSFFRSRPATDTKMVIVCRLDESVPGEYLIGIYHAPLILKAQEYRVFHDQQRFAASLATLPLAIGFASVGDDLFHKLRAGMIRSIENGEIPPEAWREDFRATAAIT